MREHWKQLWSGLGRVAMAILLVLFGIWAPLNAIGPTPNWQTVEVIPEIDEDPAKPAVLAALAAYRPNGPPAGLHKNINRTPNPDTRVDSDGDVWVIIVVTFRADHSAVANWYAYASGDPVNRWDPSGLYWQYVQGTGWEWIEADHPSDAEAFYASGFEVVDVGIHGRSGNFTYGAGPLDDDGIPTMRLAEWGNHVLTNVHWGSNARPGYVALPSGLSRDEKNAAMASLQGAIGSGIAARAAQARAANEAQYAQAMAEFERRKAEALANGRDLVDLGGGFAFDLTAARDPNHWNEASKSVLFYMMTGEGRGVVVGGEPLSWSDVGIEGLKEAAITAGTAGAGKLLSVGGRVIFRAAARHGDEVVDVGRQVVRRLDDKVDDVVRHLDDGPGVFDSRFTRDVLDYAHAVERHTGFVVHQSQRTRLAEVLRTTRFQRLSPADVRRHRNAFNRVKNSQIAEWEQQTGQVWPRYQAGNVPVGRRAGDLYDAHHIIENAYGGPHEWWNLTPARFPTEHQAGIHTEEILRRLFP